MIIDFHNLNGGGGGGTAEYATSAGTSNKSKLLLSESNFPQSANTGDVVAIGEQQTPKNGLKSGTRSLPPTTGIYQYDGSNWNKIEAGSGSSVGAYKIELSTNNPEDFTEEDIANLNAFFAAVITNPSIMDTAYLEISTEIYHISSARYNEQDGEGEFNFVLSYPTWIANLIIGYEMEEFSHAETHRWEGNTLVPAIEFPQDPAPGEIANYDDGEGNVGLYQYDADNDEWVPFGGGDNTILKSTSGVPVSIEDGDVYPVHTEPQDYQIGDDWTDTESTTPIWGEDWHDSPQAIRVQSDSGNGDKFSIYFNCSNYGTEETIKLDKDGNLEMNVNTCKKIEDNYWVFDDPAWYPYLDGEKLYAVYEAPYVYIFSTNREKIWLNYVTNNYVNNNVYTGEVTPQQPAKNDVYQYVSNEVPIVEVYGEGNYEDSIGTGSNSFAISNGGKLCIKINDVDAFNEAASGDNWTFCTYEANKEYAPIMWNHRDQTWNFYDDDGETILHSVADGDTGSFTEFDSETLYFSFDGGILKLWADNAKTFYDFNIPEGSVRIDASEKLAKDKDLQAMTPRLLPKANEDGSIPVYSSYASAWTTTNRGAIVVDGMREGYEYEQPSNGQPMALVRESYWGCGWQPTYKMVKITQADYDDLVTNDKVDPNTMYLIINPQV